MVSIHAFHVLNNMEVAILLVCAKSFTARPEGLIPIWEVMTNDPSSSDGTRGSAIDPKTVALSCASDEMSNLTLCRGRPEWNFHRMALGAFHPSALILKFVAFVCRRSHHLSSSF